MGYMFLKNFNKTVRDEDLEKWNKLHEDFNKRMKKLPNEFQIEMFEQYEMPIEEILRNAACVLCSTLPNEEFLFFDEISECRKNIYHKLVELTIKMGLEIISNFPMINCKEVDLLFPRYSTDTTCFFNPC
jgi:hypothetical protein